MQRKRHRKNQKITMVSIILALHMYTKSEFDTALVGGNMGAEEIKKAYELGEEVRISLITA